MIYPAIRLYARALVRGWYRVEVIGRPLTEPGATIVVANHTNGLVDVAFLVGWCDRPVRFLAKFSLFRTPGVAFLARGVRAIPVYRKKDRVPTERNVTAFQAVHEALANGEAIGIFPEGESATAMRLRTPLKTGAARMALGAERARPGLGVRIVPVALTYSDRDRFRSRASLVVGRSFLLDEDLVARGPEDYEAVRATTERIAAALEETGFGIENSRDAPTFALARRSWPLASDADAARLRRLARGLNELRRIDPGRADELAARAESHALDAEPATETPGAATPILAAALAFLGLASFAVPAVFARALARRAKPDKVVTVTMLALLPACALWIVAAAVVAGFAGSAPAGLLVALALTGTAVLLPRAVDGARAARPARRLPGAPRAAARRALLDELESLGIRARPDPGRETTSGPRLDCTD